MYRSSPVIIFYRSAQRRVPFPLVPDIKRLFFDKVDRDWERAWAEKVTPWETKSFTPPLKEVFDDGIVCFDGIRCNDTAASRKSKDSYALVPGCGSGLDCRLLSNIGFTSVYGIDISPTAIIACKQEVCLKNLKFECANFFGDDNAKSQYEYAKHKYDFIFDYLFFTAIEPDLRRDWARQMSQLLIPQTGRLMTLMFPCVLNFEQIFANRERDVPADDGSANAIGPPYHLSLDDYRRVMEPHGFQLCHLSQAKSSIKPRRGKEIIAIWTLPKACAVPK